MYFKSGKGSTIFTFVREEYPVTYVSFFVAYFHNNQSGDSFSTSMCLVKEWLQ